MLSDKVPPPLVNGPRNFGNVLRQLEQEFAGAMPTIAVCCQAQALCKVCCIAEAVQVLEDAHVPPGVSRDLKDAHFLPGASSIPTLQEPHGHANLARGEENHTPAV